MLPKVEEGTSDPSLQERFKQKVGSIVLSADSFITVLQYAMEIVETTQLRGSQKKAAVVGRVRRMVIDSAPFTSETTRVFLLSVIHDGLLGHMIDVLVSATRGRLNVNATGHATGILCKNAFPMISGSIQKCISGRGGGGGGGGGGEGGGGGSGGGGGEGGGARREPARAA